jgi:branched-chain amino acid transport system substrate-binding protein
MKRSSFRTRALVGVSLAMSFSVAALGLTLPAGASTNPYKVVIVDDQTGALSTTVGTGFAGAEAYIDKINAAGGVNGHKINFSVVDSQSTPQGGEAGFRNALGGNPMAILNFSLSTGLTDSISLLKTTPTPVITTSSDDVNLYPTPNKSIFMVSGSGQQQLNYALKEVLRTTKKSSLKGQRIALLGYQTAFIDAMFAKAQKEIKAAGGTVTTTQLFNPGLPSFTAQAAQVARGNPTAVILGIVSVDAPTITNALTAAGVKVPVVVPVAGGNDSPTVMKQIKAPNYYPASGAVLPVNSSVMSSAAGSTYGDDYYFSAGWISAQILAAGLKKCGSTCPSPSALQKAIVSGSPYNLGSQVAFGPFVFSNKTRAGLTAVQFTVYNPSTGKIVNNGTPLPTGP